MLRRTLAIVSLLALASAGSAGAVPPPPAALRITGTISPRGASGNYLPAAMNGGKTQGIVEVPAAWTLDPMPAGGLEPKQYVTFSDALSIVIPPPALAKKTGTCKVTIGDFGATFIAADGKRYSSLSLVVTEPGCDASQMLKETLPDGLDVTTTGLWKPTGTKVPVQLSIAPKRP